MKERDPHEVDCPECGSENIVLWLKEPKLHCHSCGHDFDDPWKDTRYLTSEQKDPMR